MPEPVSRTAAPDTTIATSATRARGRDRRGRSTGVIGPRQQAPRGGRAAGASGPGYGAPARGAPAAPRRRFASGPGRRPSLARRVRRRDCSLPRPDRGVRGAHEAPDHRAAARHHGADDGRGRAGHAVAVADRLHGARRHPRRRRRQRHQHGRRPRHRPADGAHQEPPAGHRRHVARGPRSPSPSPSRCVAFLFLWAHRQPAQRRAGRRGLPLLRVRVHALAEAHVEPQHRDRRAPPVPCPC